jgi:hypothetical protein
MKIMLGFLSIGLIVGSAQAQAYTVLDDLKVNLGRIATEVRASEHSPQADVYFAWQELLVNRSAP